MISTLGLAGSVVLLIWLALRGINIILASLICSLVVIVTNGLPVSDSFLVSYSSGPLGAFTFAGKFFLLFAAGALFGRLMGDTGSAASIAISLARKLGAHRTLWITVIASAVLTYGGVVIFVVIFAMYPLGLKLLQESNMPKRLFCAALSLGSGTFTLTALPGTPSIHNVISSVKLGTDLFAGAGIGLATALIMFALGMWYLESQRRVAERNGETFEMSATDSVPDLHESELPSWQRSLIPLVVVIGTILLPRIMLLAAPDLQGQFGELMAFARTQPIFWPSFSLMLGSATLFLLFPQRAAKLVHSAGAGTQESILPLINTSAVIGFGGVVVSTSGFQDFTAVLLNLDLPPMLSAFISVSLVSAIVGSSSGGLQIFMESMSAQYLAMGIDVEVFHRFTTIAAGGLDSLPHCGAVVAMLTITGLTHKQAYKDVGMVTVVVPIVALMAVWMGYSLLA